MPTISTNKGVTYMNVASAFDIETTSAYVDGEKVGFMYIWAFGIGYENENIYGRTWNEFLYLCGMLQRAFDLHDKNRLIIYAHNLSFEFQFMRKHFSWHDVFASAERKPLKALCSYGIEFRDSYILSGQSLSKTADNLTGHDIKKLVGDLDYDLIRTHKTPMTDDEMAYLNNDIDVVLAYIDEQIDRYKDITKVPLTNTGRVRQYVRNNCYYTNTNHRKSGTGKYRRYRAIMNDLTLTKDDYLQLKQAFMGGFTHANAKHSGEKLKDVHSIDFTSSYPAVMLSEKFPMSRAQNVEVSSVKELDYLCQRYCLLFEMKLKNVTQKITQDNYISQSKCYILQDPILNNGRVVQASELAMTVTDVDYDIIKQAYDWDEIEVSNVKRFHKGYLPKSIIESILQLYEDKTKLKGVEGEEANYLLSKGMLNSVYGMSVTDIVQDEHTYDENGWQVEAVDVDEKIDNHNKSKSRFLYYPWGVWVTAYARRNLWTGIVAMGHDYVYADTDSIKFLNYDRNADYIKWYDDLIKKKLNAMADHYKIDKSRLAPKTKEGKQKQIGVWDYEGKYDDFKTLGAKRYLVNEGGELALTVAGLSKQDGLEYMKKACNYDVDAVFDMFNDELFIDKENTGKMTHTYIDNEKHFEITDYKGVRTEITSLSSVHLENVEFTLSISRQYKQFIENLKQGYIYKGVKEI